jgi:predicted enzyme related to lactoylglutathione lyase
MTKEVAFICYPVTDMGRAMKFYEEVFGLTRPEGVNEESAWVEYLVGDTAFVLGKSDEWKPSPEGPSLAFEVPDLDSTVAKLKEVGVKFKVEKMDFPNCSMAAVYDTEGNVIVAHKRKS